MRLMILRCRPLLPRLPHQVALNTGLAILVGAGLLAGCQPYDLFPAGVPDIVPPGPIYPGITPDPRVFDDGAGSRISPQLGGGCTPRGCFF